MNKSIVIKHRRQMILLSKTMLTTIRYKIITSIGCSIDLGLNKGECSFSINSETSR